MARKHGAVHDLNDNDIPLHLRNESHNVKKVVSKEPLAVGQRIASEMEPELGLGTIVEISNRQIKIAFHNGESIRVYVRDNAPLRRIQFKVGDFITDKKGQTGKVTAIESRDSCIYYHFSNMVIHENELSDTMSTTDPLDRLSSGHTDPLAMFGLRKNILDLRNQIQHSNVRGFIGPRIEPFPHQLYLASEIANRHIRRVMLSDEVGLGKTIEACLILHRLYVSGRISQVLIVVPEPLINVWFVELIRKFNLFFTIIDDDFLEETYHTKPEQNPFESYSLVLTSLAFFNRYDAARTHFFEKKWDLSIIDEVHHYKENTPDFADIEKIATNSTDLLLLTATPSQHGERSHFARLRLLDPSRYVDYESYRNDSEHHEVLAEIINKLNSDESILESYLEELKSKYSGSADFIEQNKNYFLNPTKTEKQTFTKTLLDRFGIGRALFRNTRESIGGFPSRRVIISPLDESSATCQKIWENFFKEQNLQFNGQSHGIGRQDARVLYITKILQELKNEKILIICRTKETVIALEKALSASMNVSIAQFHEELTLLQRDRNAAYFADEEGARVLICSEIGSEGRNFQFVHHMVMFDLPLDPELAEQRIGRLDRIGQKGPIIIHVPFVKGTPDEILARWFHEGLNLFEQISGAVSEVYEQVQPQLEELLFGAPNLKSQDLESLIQSTVILKKQQDAHLRSGKDRLLELNSFHPEKGAALVKNVLDVDKNESLKKIMKGLFTSEGLTVEEFDENTWKLWSEGPLDELFPALINSRPVVTFNRLKAVQHEDMEYITVDHPSVLSGIDLFLGTQKGNCAVGLWNAGPNRELILEINFVIECVAPKELFLHRFLPQIPLKVTIDNTLKERPDLYNSLWKELLQDIPDLPVTDKQNVYFRLVPAMFKKGKEIAEKKCKEMSNDAIQHVKSLLGNEIDRLRELQKTNKWISNDEIEKTANEQQNLLEYIKSAIPRLDSVCLVLKTGNK